MATANEKQFEKKLASLGKKERRDYFEYLTKHYFNIDPKLQSFYDLLSYFFVGMESNERIE